MTAGPPRPRPWPAGEAKTVGTDGVVRLTAPHAYHIWAGVIGYHVPKTLTNANTALRGLSMGR